MHMANPNGRSWRHYRAMHDLPVEVAAHQLGIAAGSLRNIETNQPNYSVGERLVYRAARLYGVTYDDLVLDEDEPPKKKEPRKEPTAPPKRKDEGKKGPKRENGVAA